MGQRIVASVLILFSVVVSLAVMEFAARIIAGIGQQVAQIPDEWARKETVVPGARRAYYWHGALHIEDENHFRRATPIVADDAAFRILVIGDSLTYGTGVADDATYPSMIAAELSKRYRVQVTNLGVQGAQSEDILGILKRNIDVARPHLVIYGICLNDFLPSWQGEGGGISVPRRLQWSALAALTVRSINQAGMKLGVFKDFASEILADFPSLEPRFRSDLAAM